MRLNNIQIGRYAAGLVLAAGLSLGGGAVAKDATPATLTEKDKADLARIETFINGVETLQTDFTQVSATGTVRRGRLYLWRPGRMRVEFDPPIKTLIIATPVWLILIEEKGKEPQYLPLKATPAGVLVRKKISFSGDLTVTKLTRENRWISVTLQQTKEPEKGSVTMIFSTKPMALVGWTVIDAQGLPTQVSFDNTKTGVTFKKTLFQAPISKTLPPNYR
jgi:outer membrane lipoprotein-sorting protein